MSFYLDANATYGVLSEVRAELFDRLPSFQNPSSIHTEGQHARALVEEARQEVRDLMQIPSKARIIFTSGATESNAHAFYGALNGTRDKRVLVSAIEHHAVLHQAERLAREEQCLLTVLPYQELDAGRFITSLASDVHLVSLMASNNETGEIFPLATWVPLIRARAPNAFIHTDAVQLLGKGELLYNELGVDLLSISGHKLGALTGVGALVVDEHVPPNALFVGGPQETRWRAGTENLAGIISFGIASRLWRNQGELWRATMKRRSEALIAGLQTIADVQILCLDRERLPNTFAVTFAGVRGDDLVVALDVHGIRVSTGAACASGKSDPSHVYRAMGLSDDAVRSTIRFSIRADLPEDAIAPIVAKVRSVVSEMRRSS
jgi:cysteine desulfurase